MFRAFLAIFDIFVNINNPLGTSKTWNFLILINFHL